MREDAVVQLKRHLLAKGTDMVREDLSRGELLDDVDEVKHQRR